MYTFKISKKPNVLNFQFWICSMGDRFISVYALDCMTPHWKNTSKLTPILIYINALNIYQISAYKQFIHINCWVMLSYPQSYLWFLQTVGERIIWQVHARCIEFPLVISRAGYVQMFFKSFLNFWFFKIMEQTKLWVIPSF